MKGITVTLYDRTISGYDAFNHPIYEETAIQVDNVLVAPTSSDDVIDATTLEGKKAVYTLGIPKGDNHDWEDRKISFWGKTWHSFGMPLEGIENLIPLEWNKKVTVELYE
ncbi:MAG: hypothetical protein IKS99_06860 [Firmicutes bacterium]|nr:hypothetical protein [Bacillota bacterium]